MKFDLEERTEKLAESIIFMVKKIKLNLINSRIISQLIGSSGSIGANYCEAIESESKKDFIHKMGISKKEIKETLHWLKLLSCAEEQIIDESKRLYIETRELLLNVN